jgi:hypothetical protein
MADREALKKVSDPLVSGGGGEQPVTGQLGPARLNVGGPRSSAPSGPAKISRNAGGPELAG